MDKTTEYCSFVSVDYIICECGDTFPNEDALMDHLEFGHSDLNLPKKIIDDPDKEEHVKKEVIVSVKREPVEMKTVSLMPSVTTEILPEANLEPNMCLIDLGGGDNAYYLHNGSATDTFQLVLPDGVKQEDLVLQFEDQVDNDGGEEIYGDEENCGDEENYGGEEQVIVENISVNEPLASKQVRFKKQKEVVIIAEENMEHDYDSASVKPEVQEYYFCDVCGKSFKSEKAVRGHVVRMHMSAEEKRQMEAGNSMCEACGMQYGMWKRVCKGCGFKRTNKRSAYPRLYTCDVCGVSRTSNAALRYHQRTHTGERPYQCTSCPKTFTMPLFLQLHTRTHTGERPYPCLVCPKAFANQAALIRHGRVHTGEKPYKCPECGKAFTQSNSMKLHFQTVHLKLPAPYKSAARKLREKQKAAVTEIQDFSCENSLLVKHITHIPNLTNIPASCEDINKFLFKHKLKTVEAQEVPQYDFIVEEQVQYSDSNEYEDESS